MFCRHCGGRVDNSMKFCNKCGQRIDTSIRNAPPEKAHVGRYILIGLALYIGVFLIFHLVYSCLFPVDKNNVLQVPENYARLVFFVAALVAIVVPCTISKRCATNKHKTYVHIETIRKSAEDVRIHYRNALSTDSIEHFVFYWDSILSVLPDLKSYRGVVPNEILNGLPEESVMMREFHWKLRDVIERAEARAITDIRNEYHNNKNGRFKEFLDSVEKHYNRMDPETVVFAKNALASVAKAAGFSRFEICGELVVVEDGTHARPKPFSSTIEYIDCMSGQQFEVFCAALLERMGYANVSLTKTTGDHGVDIVAEKDGTRYAVQCKCYSRNLDATPIREVHAGKMLYHCHVGIVITNRYFTSSAIEEANATGTIHWDRSWLEDKLTIFFG